LWESKSNGAVPALARHANEATSHEKSRANAKGVVRERSPRYNAALLMRIVGKMAIRAVAGATVVGCAVACGSQGGIGPYGEGFDNWGFVGSGGAGGGTPHDAGSAHGEAGAGYGGSDAGSHDSGELDAQGGDAASSGDGSSHEPPEPDAEADSGAGVGVNFNIPPGFFPSLNWVISGPNGYYSGTVEFGDARSVEFVAGGIRAGAGYTLTMAGNDRYGDPCNGTSSPFEVVAGQVADASIVLTCDVPPSDAAEPADVTNGSVGIEAGVVLRDL
jgi:hypothetical protein